MMQNIKKIILKIAFLIILLRSGNKDVVLSNNVDLDKKREFDIINRKLTGEIENFKEMIKSRDEEIKVLLGIIDKYKSMEENFKKVFKKDLDPNKRLIDRLEEEDKQLADIRNNVYGNAIEFEKIKFNKNENLMNSFNNNNTKPNNNFIEDIKNQDSRNSSFSNANTKTTNANSNMNNINFNTNSLMNNIKSNANASNQVNNFFNNDNSKNNTSMINSVTNTNFSQNTKNTSNYNPVPIGLLKEINTVNTFIFKPVKISKDVIVNELKLYELFRNNYVRFSSQEEENRRKTLKDKFDQGRVLAQDYTKVRDMSNSIKTSVKDYKNHNFVNCFLKLSKN